MLKPRITTIGILFSQIEKQWVIVGWDGDEAHQTLAIIKHPVDLISVRIIADILSLQFGSVVVEIE